MLEFYSDEFINTSKEEIEFIKGKFINLLPNIEKWQMKGCAVRSNNASVYYVPISDKDKKQIGTRIVLINDIHNSDMYTITSMENSLKLKMVTIKGITKIYYVGYQNNIKIMENIFMYDNHYVICINIDDGKKSDYIVETNINDKEFTNEILSLNGLDKLDEIEKLYFDINNDLVRKRKK